MLARDPSTWVNEPLRRAMDGVLYRWLALLGAAVGAAVVHKLAGIGPVDGLVHLGLPLFLVAYIVLHLLGRIWRRRGAGSGWQDASQADRGTVVVTRAVGWAAVFGCGLALVAPLGTLDDPAHFMESVLLWTPLLLPLYALAVWVTLDCAAHRLGRGVEESRRRFAEYWRLVAAGGSASGQPG